MQVVVTTQPDPLVTKDEAKIALGESGADRDDLIEGLILAAQAELDGPKGWVGISCAEQELTVTLDSFDEPAVKLPGGPIVGDVVITYLDAAGDTQTLDDATYAVLADGSLVPVAGASWPTLADQTGAITATYDVGITDAADPRLSLMKTAIKMHVRMTLDGIEPEKSRKAIESLVRSMWVPAL